MATFTGYFIGAFNASVVFLPALLSGRSVYTSGIKAIRYVSLGLGAGALHATASYATAKALNADHSVFAHAVGGAAAGYLVRFKAPLAPRMNMILLFALSSLLIKQIELIRPEFADKNIGHCIGPVPNAYISLNHRYMNKNWRKEEEDLEKFV
ncbi:unnamed protein product [Rodentolepis nana]|uniref:Rhomboid domain-containing protein n=1 Tax=Rodentolepis nana TaxID=102285 RepID=A0A0R3T603_RODNA|nr:unnamed protein product [Rodentolepis nana]